MFSILRDINFVETSEKLNLISENVELKGYGIILMCKLNTKILQKPANLQKWKNNSLPTVFFH